MEKVRVGLIGLGFGAEFIPIYQAHRQAEVVAICQRSQTKLDDIGDRFGIAARYTNFHDVLADPNVDLVHINSPIPDHAPQTIAALKAGKHVICTVPMATTLEEAEEIVALVRETGLTYMMAETVVYSREYLFIKEMHDKGELGRIQYLQASHPQDMEGWPDYWKDMVPMHYATHVVSPLMALVDGMADYVSCFGSGTVNDEIARRSGSSFAVESCHIKVRNSDVAAHVWRFLWDTARQYRESIDVYGSLKSFEWELMTGEQPVLHTAKRPEPEIAERVEVPDFAHRLPEEIRKFTPAIVDQD
ncbi:MAG: Gfo/Idh/MocA family oxidoreductase, partial [Alphaproteobacteria bacterium]|nr:Gfo/Idh/MocA family oxidoreductase [Alphaproteobacteria bacterium]